MTVLAVEPAHFAIFREEMKTIRVVTHPFFHCLVAQMTGKGEFFPVKFAPVGQV